MTKNFFLIVDEAKIAIDSGSNVNSSIILHTVDDILLGLPYFEKQKSGHWMTNFHETRFMAPPTFFFIKSGTVRCGYRLDYRGIRGQLKPKTKIGVISKKKKRSSLVSSTLCA